MFWDRGCFFGTLAQRTKASWRHDALCVKSSPSETTATSVFSQSVFSAEARRPEPSYKEVKLSHSVPYYAGRGGAKTSPSLLSKLYCKFVLTRRRCEEFRFKRFTSEHFAVFSLSYLFICLFVPVCDRLFRRVTWSASTCIMARHRDESPKTFMHTC